MKNWKFLNYIIKNESKTNPNTTLSIKIRPIIDNINKEAPMTCKIRINQPLFMFIIIVIIG